MWSYIENYLSTKITNIFGLNEKSKKRLVKEISPMIWLIQQIYFYNQIKKVLAVFN